MKRQAMVWALLLMAATGCAKVPFTKKLVTENGLKPQDLKNLQYYVSTEVRLSREVSNTSSTSVASHELKTVKGKVVELIVIKPKTPGVALTAESSEGVMRIAFEVGDETFVFRTVDTVPALSLGETKVVKAGGQEIVIGSSESVNWDQRFKLASDSWKNDAGTWTGKIPYQQNEFVAAKGAKAYLVIKKKSLRKMETKRKVLPGRRLPDEKEAKDPPATPAPTPAPSP